MKRKAELFVFGNGGMFREVSNYILRDDLFDIVVVLEDNINSDHANTKFSVITEKKFFDKYEQTEVFVAVFLADVAARRRLVKFIEERLESLVFPSFNFSEYLRSAFLERGNIIMPGTIFTDENISIGSFNYFNFCSFIAHDVEIGSYNTFSPYVKVSGNCKVLTSNFFGTGCVLFPNIIVDDSSIGAGAVIKRKKVTGKIVDTSKCVYYDKR